MKILAFAATNSRQSLNRQLVTYAAGLLEGDEVEMLDLNDYEMPIYSIDRENESGIPKLAHAFYDKIGAADGLLISFAEHNGFYTTAYKNIFDWMSRIDKRVYQGKPSVLLATSPGPSGAANVLGAAVASAAFFGNEVVASLAIPHFFDSFDPEAAQITNPDIDARLREALTALTATTAPMKAKEAA